MLHQRDKNLGWAIVFSAFLVLLISSIACAIFEAPRRNLPRPITLAETSFNKHFVQNIFTLIRYISIAAMGFGAYGVITWPSGP